MKFYDKEGKEITQAEAQTTLIGLYDHEYKPLEIYLDYIYFEPRLAVQLGAILIELCDNNKKLGICTKSKTSAIQDGMKEIMEGYQWDVDCENYVPDERA